MDNSARKPQMRENQRARRARASLCARTTGARHRGARTAASTTHVRATDGARARCRRHRAIKSRAGAGARRACRHRPPCTLDARAQPPAARAHRSIERNYRGSAPSRAARVLAPVQRVRHRGASTLRARATGARQWLGHASASAVAESECKDCFQCQGRVK